MNPLYNLREMAKQLILLEDHLSHERKRCPDCIRKHLLTCEALAEEAVTLDEEFKHIGYTSGLAEMVRGWWTRVQNGDDFNQIAQDIRGVRKELVKASAEIRVASMRRVAARHLVAKQFTVNVGDPVLYGKYKNKKGVVVGFKTDPKGNPIVLVDPIPKGRKQTKEIQLMRIWYDKSRVDEDDVKTAAAYGEQIMVLRRGEQVDPDKLARQMLQSRVKNTRFGFPNKPNGVVWTSTLEGDRTDWMGWCSQEMPHWVGEKAISFDASGAKVRHLTSLADLQEVAAAYPHPNPDAESNSIDYEAMAADWDAVHFAKGVLRHMPGLDAESTAWLNASKLKPTRVIDVDMGASCRLKLGSFRPITALLQDTGEQTWQDGTVWEMDVSKDEFIHFTPADRAQEILESGKLLFRPPYKKFGGDAVYAVSTQWGGFQPRVATTHYGDVDLVGILFKTGVPPKVGFWEEVSWDRDVPLKQARIVPYPKAVGMLRRTPHQISPDDMVVYGSGRAASLRVAARYKNKKKVKTQDGDEITVYEYSERQVQNRHREKSERIEKLRGNIDKLRTQVKKDLTSDDPKTRLTALAVALMDATYERVGNEESAKDGHFGVTCWKKDHVSISGNTATISYVGKSGVKQKKKVSDSAIVSALKKALEGKGKDDQVIDGGEGANVKASDVNAYLKKYDITAKDIRGLHANEEMKANLKRIRGKGGKLPEDKKEREKKLKDEFKEALEAAAAAVGHEASTLRSQYLVPHMEDEFVKDGTIIDSLKKKGSAKTAGKSRYEREYDKILRRIQRLTDEQAQRVGDALEENMLNGWNPDGDPWTARELAEMVEMAVEQHVNDIPYEDWPDPYEREVMSLNKAMRRLATKDRAEREDEATEKVVKRLPKKKPPRKDLRKRRIEVDENDKDPDEEQDRKDRSHNWKDVGGSLGGMVIRVALTHLARRPNKRIRKKQEKKRREQQEATPEAPLEEHSPGDVWETDNGWRGMNQDGEAKTFPEKEEAETFAAMGEATPEEEDLPEDEDPEEDLPEDDDPEDPEDPEDPQDDYDRARVEAEAKARREQTKQKVEDSINEVLKDPDIPDKLRKEMDSALEKMDAQAQSAMLGGFTKQLRALRSQEDWSEDDWEALQEDARESKNLDGVTSGKVGELLARAYYFENFQANPLRDGDKRVSTDNETKLSGMDQGLILRDRSRDSYRRFKNAPEEVRANALKTVLKELDSAEEGTPRRTELRAIRDGLAHTFISNGEQPPGMKEVSETYLKIAKKMAENGDDEEVLGPASLFQGAQFREAFKRATDDMSDDEVADMVPSDSPLRAVAEALKEPGLSDEVADQFREHIITSLADRMLIVDPMEEAFAKANGTKKSKLPPSKIEDPMAAAAADRKKMLGLEPQAVASLRDQARYNAVGGRYEMLRKHLPNVPDTPETAIAEAVVREKRTNALDQRVVLKD